MIEKTEPKKRGRPPKVVVVTSDEVQPPVLKAVILSLCNNPTWVKGRIDGFGVYVKIPTHMAKRLIGKEVKVILVSSEIEDYYQYIA